MNTFKNDNKLVLGYIIRSLYFLFFSTTLYAQPKNSIYILGTVFSKETGNIIQNVSVKVNNSTYTTVTDNKGKFIFHITKVKHYSLLFQTLGYKSQVKEIETDYLNDTIKVFVFLKLDSVMLLPVVISAKLKPDTVFGTNKYSIVDFNFYEDKFILLTFFKSMDKTTVRLVDEFKNEVSKVEVPTSSGNAKELFEDYMGYTNVICRNAIYRVVVRNEEIKLFELPMEDYIALVKPVIDTSGSNLVFSNYNPNFPMFSYYFYNLMDSSYKAFATIIDKNLMDLYRFEYYFLKPAEKLEARNFAQEFKIDKHVAAAMMTGFTNSIYYTPLYAPLFVVGDTIRIFDHYKDYLYHYNSKGNKLDSMPISYHHPKKWKEWKNVMIKDVINGNIFAIFSKDGHKYMKKINYRSGKEEGIYKIIHFSADNIKVKENFIYYVYRPYESTQEKFLYKEKIVLKN